MQAGRRRGLVWLCLVFSVALAVWLLSGRAAAPPLVVAAHVAREKSKQNTALVPAAAPPSGAEIALPLHLPPLPNAPPAAHGDPLPLPQQRYHLARDEAYCDHILRCPPPHKMGNDPQACRATMAIGRRITEPPYLEGLAHGRLTYDPLAAARCVQAQAYACDGVEPAVCAQVFRGTVADGGTCWFSEECLGEDCNHEYLAAGVCGRKRAAAGQPCDRQTYCDQDLDCVDGKCRACGKTVGAPCKDICFNGADDLWCDDDASPAVCRERLGVGQVCPKTYGACREGLSCLAAPDGNRCSARYGVGGPCDPEYSWISCEKGLVCVPQGTGGICARKQQVGGPCLHEAQCEPSDATYCLGASATNPGQCAQLPSEGEPCAPRPANERLCASPWLCDLERRICVRQIAEGHPCTGYCGGGGLDLTCVSGFCRNRLAAGAACPPDAGYDGAPRCVYGFKCIDGRCAAR